MIRGNLGRPERGEGELLRAGGHPRLHVAVERIFVFPDNLPIRTHFEKTPLRTGANERVTVRETMPGTPLLTGTSLLKSPQ